MRVGGGTVQVPGQQPGPGHSGILDEGPGIIGIFRMTGTSGCSFNSYEGVMH
jgi:hypothetical protein